MKGLRIKEGVKENVKDTQRKERDKTSEERNENEEKMKQTNKGDVTRTVDFSYVPGTVAQMIIRGPR
jgi:hypothetical protein